MKVSLTYASKTWGIYAVLVVLSAFFLAGISTLWLQVLLSLLLFAGFLTLIFNEAAYNGEKACTLAVSLEKQLKEGRRVDEKARQYVFSRKTGIVMFIICVAPFLLLSTINLIVAPYYPEPAVAQEEEVEREPFSFDYEAALAAQEDVQVNVVNVIARIVFMPYVCTYELVSATVLNWLFLLYSLIAPGIALTGYMLGPVMRVRKLKSIALGKKRKMRNLKVNKDKGPRRPKAEV